MDVRELGPALMGLGALCHSANARLNEDRATIKVVVYLFTADARVGAGQKRPPRLSYSACSGPGGSRFANWANGLNGLRASWVD